MISCTEFIPSYSELFSFLDENYGFEEVQAYWNDIFDPERDGILNRRLREQGLRGCFAYWNYSLNEEAADFRMMLNEEDGWFTIEMRRCPSKGRLMEMKQLRPYGRYCLHCDLYRKTVEKYGLRYDYDFTKTDKAQCSILICDPKVYKGTRILTPRTIVVDRREGDNRYLHREFHNYLNMGVDYLGRRFGREAVEKYLARFARNYHRPLIDEIREEGLAPLEAFLRRTYEAEEAPDLLHTERTRDSLEVRVDACPAVRYLKDAGWEVSQWYFLTTQSVMKTVAEESGYAFSMISYDPASGAANYVFRGENGADGGQGEITDLKSRGEHIK